MILVDTSVWIELLNGRQAGRDSSPDLTHFATCGPVAQEVLQGMRADPASEQFRQLFLELPMLGDPLPSALFLRAADMYRLIRGNGYTIRSSTDCLIATIAIEYSVAVWHRDRDFDTIARFTALQCTAPD